MEITGETLDVILDALAEQLRSLGEQMEVVRAMRSRAVRSASGSGSAGRSSLLRWGLPTGFMTRVVTRHYR